MMMAVLQIDHAYNASSREDRDRQECLVTIFRQFVEKLEPRVLGGALRNGNWLAMLSNPSGNSLPDAQFQTVDYFLVGILGCAKNQFVIFEDIQEAGVTFYEGRSKIHDTGQNLMKSLSRAEPHRDFMKYINMRIFYRDQRVHEEHY